MGKELKKILLVEDEEDIRTLLRMALESGDFQVMECSDGFEALRKGGSFRPDLLLMDVMMPGMDGLMAVEKLRERPGLKNTPAVFITAKAQAREIERFKALGSSEVITKPFDPLQLPVKIREIWGRIKGGAGDGV